MQIPGFSKYDWNGNQVFNKQTGNFLQHGARRRVTLNSDEGVRIMMTIEEVEAMCLDKHPREMEDVVEGATKGTWLNTKTGRGYQEIDGKVHVIRRSYGNRLVIQTAERTFRVTDEEFLKVCCDEIKGNRAVIAKKRFDSNAKKSKEKVTVKQVKKAKSVGKKVRPKKQESVNIPGFGHYTLVGESVISSLGMKPRELTERSGKYVLIDNQDRRHRLSLEEIKALCEAN